MVGCAQKDAFSTKKLDFTAEISNEQDSVKVTGKTNLPDGFVIFVRVDAAPQYLSGTSWSGQTTVLSGQFQFDTIFTAALPYNATCIISPAINPKWRDRFSGSKVPFTVDQGWKIDKSDGGFTQIAISVKSFFGTKTDHQRILSPAVKELRKALGTLDHEMNSIDKLMKNPKGGYAQFGRLHANKRRTLRMDNGTTSFYYPDVFELLQNLNRYLEDYFLYVLASFEKDMKEKEKHKNAKEKVLSLKQKTEQKLKEIEKALGISE